MRPKDAAAAPPAGDKAAAAKPGGAGGTRSAVVGYFASSTPTNYNMARSFISINSPVWPGDVAARAIAASKRRRRRPPPSRRPPPHSLQRPAPQLTFRVLGQIQKRPGANGDDLALALHGALMPVRTAWLRFGLGAAAAYRFAVDAVAPGAIGFVDARTKWFDCQVREALAGGGIGQVVVLAAGFDTRALRFGHPATVDGPPPVFVEIDLPQPSAAKAALVSKLFSAAPRPDFVAADLSTTPLATALGRSPRFDAARPTLFTAEGLLYYVPAPAVDALLAAIAAAAAPGSRLAFDFIRQSVIGGTESPAGWKATARAVAAKGEPFLSGLPDDEAQLRAHLAPLGLRLLRVLGARAMAAEHGPPGAAWSDSRPPLAPFYSYALAEKI
jgi:methyltransferase (TIGR00027 family)